MSYRPHWMKESPTMFKLLLIASLIAACGGYTPWQSDSKHHDLTRKHLAKLEQKGNLAPFTFAIIGDSQVRIEGFNEARKRINDTNVDFTVILGDITDRGLREEWNWVGDIIKKFRKPVLTVVGNHDGLAKGKTIYRDMFGDLNYSFYYNGVKFVMWNNNHYEWNVDLDWLDQETNYHPSIVLSHQPPYAGTLKDYQEERWLEIRQKPEIIASAHGHMHNFTNYEENDLPIFVVESTANGSYGVGIFDGKSITYGEVR